MSNKNIPLKQLLQDVRQCKLCEAHLPLGPNPVVRASKTATILIIGQAPGTKVHATSIPWNDPSGDRLRTWMGIDRDTFYNEKHIAIMPMGFCYPGKGKSGDLPPRPECAQHWHHQLLAKMPDIQLTLLVGNYAQKHYLQGSNSSLTERVKNWQHYLPKYFPLVHPSPRNQRWLKNNPWFEEEVVVELKKRVKELMQGF